MARKSARETNREPETLLSFDDTDIEIDPADEEERAAGDLANLDGPEFADWEWTVFRLRTVDAMQQSGTRNQRVWVCKKVGPINLAEIQAELGGGWFEFWGKVGGVLRKKVRRELEGEPIIRRSVKPVDVVVPANGTGTNGIGPHRGRNGTLRLLREMRRDRRMMQRLMLEVIRKPAPPPPPPPAAPGLGDVVGAVAAIHQLAGTGKAGGMDTTELMQTIFNTFRQGLELGQEREPIRSDGSDPNPWGPAIEKGLDVLGTILRQQQARPRPGQRPPSHASVVEQPGARTEATATPGSGAVPPNTPRPAEPPPPEFVRWAGAADRLYRGITNVELPEDVADDIAGVLDASQYAMLVGTQDPTSLEWQPTVDQVLAYLASETPWGSILARYPQLEAEESKAYLAKVLAALRTEDDESPA